MIHTAQLFALIAGCLAAPTQPRTQPATTTQPDAINRILDQMEQAGKDIQTIQCSVVYTVDDRLNLTKSTRSGEILFKRAEPNPMFLIRFDSLVADDIRYNDKQWWLFRDRWLWQIEGKSRTIIKREYVRPGARVDFFDLQSAPFPIPFGQQRQQILDNFDVSLVAPQVDDPKNTDHLVCRPRPDAPLADEYARLDFFVDRELHLPVRIVAESVRGDQVTVAVFPDLTEPGHINIELPDSRFEQPAETQGYHVTEEPLQPVESAGEP